MPKRIVCERCGQPLKPHESNSVANVTGSERRQSGRFPHSQALKPSSPQALRAHRVIDGRPFTWDQVGRMLMSFEGFTLRAFVDDSIEVVGGPLLEHEGQA
jgi:hypothetical protein